MSDSDELSAAPGANDSVEQLLARAVEAPPVFPTLAPGTVVADRYEIERVLGSGGMGTVYLARDRTLDRDVALKLHRTPAASERLHREALAMAKLAHPNVVTVFEIGELDGRPFVAMEYVHGSTLREWLVEHERTPREILLAMLAAGEGLAAAHDAGLVHRDVKPDNIFVGADGRVRIGDFGLAQLGRIASDAVDVPIEGVTATGMIVGTPAYMAPEQIEGGELDARTDQFAFCVATWEAMSGTRPFGGATTQELRDAIRRGEPVRSRRRIAPLIRRVLVRGMAHPPLARWPSMRKLLAALRSAERRPRLTAAAVGSALALGAAIAWTAWPAPDPAAACADSGAEIATQLPAASVEAAIAAVRRDGRANANDEAARIQRHVDDFRTGYRDLARVTCEARAGGQWTSQMLAASQECRSLRVRTLRELLAIAQTAATQPSDVLPILTRTPSLLACADPQLVASWRWLEPGQVATDAIVAARARLDAAAVLVELGQLADARAVRDEPRIAAAAATNRDVQRRLALLTAILAIADDKIAGTESQLAEVYYDARAENDADIILASATQLIDLAARVRRDRAAAERWTREGLVEAQHLQLYAPQRTLELIVTAAASVEELGDHQRALELCDAAERIGMPRADDRRLAIMPVRANALASTGKLDAAIAISQDFVDRLEELLGAAHPRVADALAQHAALLAEANQDDKAYAAALAATQILDHNPRENTASIATAALNLGVTLLKLQDPSAGAQLERARAIWVAMHGEHHPDVALVDVNLALVYMDRGDTRRALALLREATATQERTLGPDHFELAAGLYNLAVAERQAGDLPAALATSRRCAAILAKHEAGSARHAGALVHAALVLNLMKRFDDALATASEALQLRDLDEDPQSAAWGRLEAARALVGLRRDPTRARQLLQEARARYGLLGMTARVVEIDGILASLR